MKPLLLLQIALFIGFGLVQAKTDFNETVYSPDKGVICDKKAGFCVDSYGISMAFTQMFLGQAAQDNFMALIDEVGSKNFDTQRFSFSNNVYCDTEKKRCVTDRFNNTPEPDYNAILFTMSE
ncbi:YcgJ family protein [Photobacterium japonica]|uniref:YcgJ family protein n=1 Tax=Photobacterium japonica TaxID=2910235 RepID=UPI003D0AA4AF